MDSLFTSALLRDRPVHIIGQGALGGPLAENLFRKGVPELRLWDFDVIEPRNRFNQRVSAGDVGRRKIEARERALREIYPESETKLAGHFERVVPGTQLSGIVLCAVDWNRIRYEEVWPCVRENPDISFFGDGRVGLDGGKVYGLDPNNPYHVLRYEHPTHHHPDPENGERDAACKSAFPMPENAEAVAAELLWRLTRWLHLEQGCEDPYDNFVGWQNIPGKIVLTEQWDSGTIKSMHTAKDDMDE